jgi:hypothetical protein
MQVCFCTNIWVINCFYRLLANILSKIQNTYYGVAMCLFEFLITFLPTMNITSTHLWLKLQRNGTRAACCSVRVCSVSIHNDTKNKKSYAAKMTMTCLITCSFKLQVPACLKEVPFFAHGAFSELLFQLIQN